MAKLLLLFLLAARTGSCFADDVTVSVRASTTIATTDENFICVTLDWWPPEKCNYDQCPWGNSSIINLELKNHIFVNAVRAFQSLRIRFGGSLQDQVIYQLGEYKDQCPDFKLDPQGLFGFSQGCLTMQRWKRINKFVERTGVVVTFGLNALMGKTKMSSDGLYGGNWDPSNARDFIAYTLSKGFQIDSYELGNELCAEGIGARVEAEQYAQDCLSLYQVIEDVYQNATQRPTVLAPGGFFDSKWFATMLQKTGPNIISGVTHHVYNLGPGDDKDLIYKVQDPVYLSKVAETYKDAQATVANFGPWASPWIGEAGGAYNSGGRTVSHTFADSFWYLDTLGMAATYGHKVFCRQALIGGNYALLNTTSFVPNPDYYGALLWHRLMGSGVLAAVQNTSPFLRVYAHCSKDKAGIAILFVNLSNSTSFDVTIADALNFYPPEDYNGDGASMSREEYHLTPKDGDIQSDVLLLNGSPLILARRNKIPPLRPIIVDASSPVYVVMQSIVFVKLPDFKAPACSI